MTRPGAKEAEWFNEDELQEVVDLGFDVLSLDACLRDALSVALALGGWRVILEDACSHALRWQVRWHNGRDYTDWVLGTTAAKAFCEAFLALREGVI